MPAPSSYTEATLATFMVVELGGIATALGWTTASSAIVEAVSDTAIVLDAAIADITDMAAIRVVARLSAWRMAEGALASSADWTVDNESLKRSQLWDHAKAMAARYEHQALGLGIAAIGGSGTATIHSVVRSEDAYAPVAVAGSEF